MLVSRRPKHGLFNFLAEVDQSHADQLAVMAVTALREVFGVTHPAFLVGDVGIGEDTDLPYADAVDLPDEPLATTPDGREHLDQLVEHNTGRVPNEPHPHHPRRSPRSRGPRPGSTSSTEPYCHYWVRCRIAMMTATSPS